MPAAGSLLTIIADSLPEPVLIFSPHGRLQAINEAASTLTGLAPAAVDAVTLGELLGDTAAAAVVLAQPQDAAATKRAIPFAVTLYAPGCRGGGLRGECWRINAGAKAAVGIRLFEPEARKHCRVLARIAEGLTAAAKLRPAAECQAAGLASAISEVCAFTGWAYAEAWLPSEGASGAGEGPQWVAHPFWYGSREKYGAFRALSLKAANAAPLPLVSRVASEQSALWFSDVSSVPLGVYRRARAAREAGLKATFAQPVVKRGRTLAVLVFMMAETRASDDALAGLMAEVARRLAPLLTAPQGREEPLAAAVPRAVAGEGAGMEKPRELALLCRLLDGLGAPVFVASQEDRNIAWANEAACRAFGYSLEALVGTCSVRLHVDEESFEEFGQRSLPLLKAGKTFRHRFRLKRSDGTRFVSEHLIVPLGEVGGQKLMVSFVSDLSQSARLAFGRRLELLSQREQEVFQLTVVGASLSEIAARLGLSVRTVEAHRSHMLRKLGCTSTNKLLADLLADSLVERAKV